MKTTAQLREDYINEFRALQHKRREHRDDFILLVLLLAFFVDYIEKQNTSRYFVLAPFIPKIKNIDNAKVVVKAIDEALNRKGKLDEHIQEFKKINQKTLDSLNNIIPQIEPKIKQKGENKRLIDLHNEAEVTAKGNVANLMVNEMLLGKKMKQWNTQRDSKVRKTTFHNDIDRKVVPINEPFIVEPFQAMYPSDYQLPPFDRYGCRCYLTYFD